MRHRVTTNNLSRTGSHRKALARNLACAIIEHERIETTLTKAKAHRPFVEKLVTLAKEKNLHNYRRALAIMGNHEDAVNKLFNVLGPRFKDRPGGYTRILKLATPRLGDKADRAIFEFVERSESEIEVTETTEE
ncbi:MAG TPA: 50S ribosomal protein L17 [Planctomycetota bacterium]|nr:50S ribosomal protein L17 [Planctomycetota bacterium]MDP6129747.1 50S ribosomal protein L17 [Planctomycetota bacterium]MDP7245986.1 50S ribosomal protein L17 [Planctomycetota bacterium]MDP7560294.1 50S ribosomal protein L17 [Planctomycetota bacterium]HJM39337.1 50S ribosomal protein L17 [Planctomycetota bacterium]